MGLIWLAAAAAWGAAEASFFFIVPDVLLTFATIRFGFRAGFRLAVTAATAASLTGAAMWLWSAHDPEGAQTAMLAVPAIGPDLLTRVHREFDAFWALHMVAGSVSGVPYKLYAVEAGTRGLPLFLFLPMSLVARLIRFTLTVALATAGRAFFLSRQQALIAWALGWLALYAVYFSLRAAA